VRSRIRRVWRDSVSILTMLMILFGCNLAYAAPASSGPRPPLSEVEEAVARWETTTARKGALGERNIASALKAFGKGSVYEAEERYLGHEVLDHGIDAIYREVRTKRFNIVESKATSETGRLYKSLMGSARSAGEHEMDDLWIRKKLAELYRMARDIATDPAASREARLSATRTLRMVDEISAMRVRNAERTLIITRLRGVDPGLSAAERLAPDLVGQFDHVIEVARSGRVLAVHR